MVHPEGPDPRPHEVGDRLVSRPRRCYDCGRRLPEGVEDGCPACAAAAERRRQIAAREKAAAAVAARLGSAPLARALHLATHSLDGAAELLAVAVVHAEAERAGRLRRVVDLVHEARRELAERPSWTPSRGWGRP